MRNTRNRSLAVLLCVVTGSAVSMTAAADVTIQQQTSFEMAIIKMHGTTTEYTTSDKERRDSDNHCEGMMSLFCGNLQSGEIVRLDKEVSWQLDPKKKQYRETPFPTAAQRQAAQQHAQEVLAKLQQCPAAKQTGPDTSKCDMSPPVVDVKTTDSHAMFAGHDSKLTQVSLTQMCRNKQTGDECNIGIYTDVWLTQDALAGLDERRAFTQAYLKKMGLDDTGGAMQKQLQQFLAAYADSVKQLQAKAADLKGYPLKTTLRIAYGGEHCTSAKQNQSAGAGSGTAMTDAGQAAGDAATSSAAGAAGSAAGAAASNAAGNGVGGGILGSAASAFGSKLASGLFKKKQQASTDAAPAAAPRGKLTPAGHDSGRDDDDRDHRHHARHGRGRSVRDPGRLEPRHSQGARSQGEGGQLPQCRLSPLAPAALRPRAYIARLVCAPGVPARSLSASVRHQRPGLSGCRSCAAARLSARR